MSERFQKDYPKPQRNSISAHWSQSQRNRYIVGCASVFYLCEPYEIIKNEQRTTMSTFKQI